MIRIKERYVKGDGVNDEAPLVLKRKPDVEPGKPSLARKVIMMEVVTWGIQLVALFFCYHL
jgi:hypothetical protein